MARQKTKHVGVYQRASAERLYQGKPDVCFDITYKTGARKVWEKIGWRSEGYTAAMAAHVRADRVRALRHSEELPAQSKPITMRQAWERYRDDHLAGHSSAKGDGQRYAKHIDPVLGGVCLGDITALDISRLRDRLLKSVSPQTAKHVLAQIRRIMRRCIDWGLFVGPLPKIEMPRVENERWRFLTHAEATALMDALRVRSVQLCQYSTMSLYTGMRAGEVFRLRGYHIDRDAGIIHVVDGRKGLPRDVYITPAVAALLDEINPSANDYVFPADIGGPIKQVSATFFRVVAALGLNDGVTDGRGRVCFHTLRHTYASWLAQDGVPLYVIGSLLGHSTEDMTRRYSHLCPDTRRSAAMRIEAIHGRESAPCEGT